MQKNKKNIFVLGTCRAHDLAKHVCNGSDDFFLLNRGDVFLHTTKEIINVIDYKTRKGIPSEYKRYLTYKSELAANISQADLFFIEISSNKCIKFNEYYFKLINNNFPNKDSYRFKLDRKTIINDAAFICKKLKKDIVFISHFNPLDKNNKPIISQRDFMSKLTKEIAEKNNKMFFNPADYFVGGWNKYIDDELYHYKEFGKKAVGEELRRYLGKEF